MKMRLDSLEPLVLGGVTQWIRIRSQDPTHPVLLLMQQGPGLPIINDARRFGRTLRLEEAFTVVYWDQRGTGLSSYPLRRSASRFDITAAGMVQDTVDLLEILAKRFGGKTTILGFSFGATYAAHAAAKRPDLVESLIAVGMDIDVPKAERHTYQFVLGTARERHNRRALRQLKKIGPPPHLTTEQFQTRARWAANFGGVTRQATFADILRGLLTSLIRSPDYDPFDIVRTLRGVSASQAALLPQLANTDLVTELPHLDTPLTMIHGRYDQVVPGTVARQYFDSVSAPSKRFEWFEESAHTPPAGRTRETPRRHHGAPYIDAVAPYGSATTTRVGRKRPLPTAAALRVVRASQTNPRVSVLTSAGTRAIRRRIPRVNCVGLLLDSRTYVRVQCQARQAIVIVDVGLSD